MTGHKALNPLWWVGLISGVLVLHREGLCPAGLRRHLGPDGGVDNIVRAFQIRRLHEEL
jgi:hypothetical protein